MKMYILIKEDVPLGLAINSAAHASLICYLKFAHTTTNAGINFDRWLNGNDYDMCGVPILKSTRSSFKKVTCKVSAEEFEAAKSYLIPRVIVTEKSLDGKEVAICFAPIPEEGEPGYDFNSYYKKMKFFRLYK